MQDHLVRLSKYLAKYLRHAPHELGLTLQPGGWVPVNDLLDAARSHGFPISYDDLVECVETNDKQRFDLDESGALIRANQGHSVEVDLHLEQREPPEFLYHGTVGRFVPSILEEGLVKGRRHHVHLSLDVETAMKVGERRGLPVIVTVDARRMHLDGHRFFISANGVWLTDSVPSEYLWTGPIPRVRSIQGKLTADLSPNPKRLTDNDYRHLEVHRRGNEMVVNFIDLERVLWNTHTFMEIAGEFHELVTSQARCAVVLDLGFCNVSDTERLFSVLVRFKREVREVNGVFKLSNLSKQIREDLDAIRLTNFFSICDPDNASENAGPDPGQFDKK